MNKQELCNIVGCISQSMTANKDYLIELDAKFGDGDLGISMSSGFLAVYEFLQEVEEADLGYVLMKCASVFNKTSPSTLGTILSFGFMGAAKQCKGKTDLSLEEVCDAMTQGLEQIMVKAQSNPGDKTIIDSLSPAIAALRTNVEKGEVLAYKAAFEAAEQGMNDTKDMKSVHGRAAYYGDKVIGHIDGGAVVGKLIFESIYNYYNA